MFEHYKKYNDGATRQAYQSKTKFSFEEMKNKINSILNEHVPEFPKEAQLVLPKLPKLQKIN
jgi:hypothetical protein